MAHSGLQWDQVFDWSQKAHRHVRKSGARVTTGNFRIALRALGAPFLSEQIFQRFSKHFLAVMRDIEENPSDAPESPEAASARSVLNQAEFSELPDMDEAEAVWGAMTRIADHSVEKAEAASFATTDLPAGGPIGLILMGDMHVGSHACDYGRLDWVAKQAQRTDIPIFLLQIGDFFDNMHWLNSECAENGPIQHHVVGAGAWLKKVAGKLIAVCAGNHDLWTLKKTQVDLLDYAFVKAGIEPPHYNGEELTLDLYLEEIRYRFVLRHVAPGNSMWNPAQGVVKWTVLGDTHHDADAIVAGHTHRSGYQSLEAHGRFRHGFQLGAYKRYQADSYAIEKGFPNRNVHPDMMAVLFPDRKEVKAFPCTEDGVLHLERIWSAKPKSISSEPEPKKCQSIARGKKKAAVKKAAPVRRRTAATAKSTSGKSSSGTARSSTSSRTASRGSGSRSKK